ncbi:MAG TPA: hypothetical protein VKA14_01385 [Gammaproteobacteria bacterium]|nr:hypothetical protein [Gammaproteobacteria bacterium]
MKVDSSLSQAVLGIQRGMQSLNKHAGEIADARQMKSGNATDLAQPLVGLSQDRLQVEASAKVASTTDKLIGSLFDQKA